MWRSRGGIWRAAASAEGFALKGKNQNTGLIPNRPVSPASWTTAFYQQVSVRSLGGSLAKELEDDSDSYDLEKTAAAVGEPPYPVSADKHTGRDAGQTQSTMSGAGHSLQAGKLSRLLMMQNCHASVLPILKQWILDGNSLPKNMVVVALTRLKRDHRYKQALEVAEYAWRERLYEMNDIDHTYRLYLTGQAGSIEDVEKCFAVIPSELMTEMVYNQLISCYISRGMISEAKSALENLKNSGQLVSVLPYNQFMALYKHLRQPQKALELMEDMKALNITPDTKTYNILLSTSHKLGDIDGVLKTYNAMRKAGVAPDVLTFSVVAKAYVAAGMDQEAASMATEMKRISPENCHLAHDLLLSIYAEQGKREELEKLWTHLQSYSNLSTRSYGVMIESLGKLGLIKEAENLATKAERKKGTLVARVFNAMMDVYARHGMMQAAEALMTRIRMERLRPSSVTYMHLITGYLKVGQPDKALEYLKTSRESLTYDHSKPWFESFLLVLNNIAERGDIGAAEHTFEVFTATGSYRNTVAYNTLLKAYLKARKPAVKYLQRMSNNGVQSDAETLALLAEIDSVCREPI